MYNNGRCKENPTEGKENKSKEQGGKNNGEQPHLMMKRTVDVTLVA